MIAPHVILRMRLNRWHAGCRAIACVYAGPIAADYTSLIREAVGPFEAELRALAADAVQRNDSHLYNFACHVFTASGFRRRAA